jgi:predicted patatin/cPLA2 family phospholipase
METYNIQLDKSQIISIISQMSDNDKADLLKKLQESTWLKRFEKLLGSLQTDELSLDDITKEVEDVRQKRFNEGKHND